jgi:hypothetical protein
MAQALLSGENFSATFKVTFSMANSTCMNNFKTYLLLQTFDLLQDHDESEMTSYDVCLDKGTFDAISLCPKITQEVANKKYLKNVLQLVKDDGIFILTSCNWTTKELVTFSKDLFNFTGIIPTPQFNFGGKSGNLWTLWWTLSLISLRSGL